MSPVSLRDISVAVLSYNRREELLATLGVVCRPELDWHEIIVADNGSTDGSPQCVRARFPQVRVLALDTNVGIEGSNRAYRAASAPWVLSLDDDSAPAIETFGALTGAFAEADHTAAIALSVRRSAEGAGAATGLESAFGFSSAGVLFNRDAIEAVGAYDPELFLFTNELHWTARALLAGWSVRKCSSAVVVHRSSPRNRQSATHAFYYCRNLLLFLLRYAPEAERPALVKRYLRDVLAYTLLHRTGVYLRACRSAWDLAEQTRSKVRAMPAEVFGAINPDLRIAYGYLR
jgi:GT2 family glycosyltransferase